MMIPHRTSRRLLAVAAAVPLALVACGDDGSTSTSTDEGTADEAEGGETAEDLSIEITSPTDGEEVEPTFDLALDASVPVGETEPHHIHVLVDGEGPDMIFQESHTVEGLEPGEHEVEAVLVNQDHSPTDASDTVTVDVTGTGGDNGGGDNGDMGY